MTELTDRELSISDAGIHIYIYIQSENAAAAADLRG